MPESYSAAQIAETLKQYDSDPYILLLYVEVPSTPVKAFRIANQPVEVVFDTDSEGAPLTWDPYNFEIGTLKSDTEGGLHNVKLTLTNQAREVQAAVEEYDGLIGQPVILQVVKRSLLATNQPLLKSELQIVSIPSNTESAVVFELGNFNLYKTKFPGNRFVRDHCRFPYKGSRCGYTGGLTDCDKGLNTENGCAAHSNEVRFGGFPGLKRQ